MCTTKNCAKHNLQQYVLCNKHLFNNVQKSERHRRGTQRRVRSQVDESMPKNRNGSQHTSMHENKQATQSTTRFAGVHRAKSGNDSLCTFFTTSFAAHSTVIFFLGPVACTYIFKCFAVFRNSLVTSTTCKGAVKD